MWPTLRAEMARNGIKTKDIQELLGVGERTAQTRLNGKTAFTVFEMIKIKERFFPNMTIDELFKTEI